MSGMLPSTFQQVQKRGMAERLRVTPGYPEVTRRTLRKSDGAGRADDHDRQSETHNHILPTESLFHDQPPGNHSFGAQGRGFMKAKPVAGTAIGYHMKNR
jgi:hypothetical protein